MNTGTNNFKRKGAKIEYKPMLIKENTTIFVEIISNKIAAVNLKSNEGISYFVQVVDMTTGEEKTLWLTGSLKHEINKLASLRDNLKGLKLEVTLTGKVPLEVDGDTFEANKYDIYELQ